jgi:branched-chain amino acid transport system substrate-binding protein
MKSRSLSTVAAVLLLGGLSFSAGSQAQIKVGVTLSATGPAASLGIPEKNTFALVPTTIAGQKIEYIVLDDASDTTRARQNMEKLIGENKVDVIIGSTITPNSLAMVEVAGRSETPMISMAASARIIEPMDANRHWVFKTPQNDSHMATAITQHMADNGVKSVAYVGFNDAYGEGWWQEFSKLAEVRKIRVVASERYSRSDTSVTGQILKILATNPDAVLIGAAGTPAVLPQATLKERGYKGKIYQTHGIANNDFSRVGGKNVEGTLLPAGPMLVAEQLPEHNPVRKTALEYRKAYETANGAGSMSTFGGHAWDSVLMLQRAIPGALKRGRPGTAEFRVALRDELENIRNLVVTHGVMNMSKTDHLGFDQRARVMVTIREGKWVLLK